MQIAGKLFLVCLFLCCTISIASAEFLKLKDPNLYVLIRQDNKITFTKNKWDATNFILTDEIYTHNRLGSSKKFTLIHKTQDDSWFLVCDTNGLRLIPKNMSAKTGYFWQQDVDGACVCCHFNETTLITSSNYCIFSIEI